MDRYEVAQADGGRMSWEVLVPGKGATVAAGWEGASELAGVRGHRYAIGIIACAIELVLYANTSFRAAARCFGVFLGADCRWVPSFWSIRNWVLRLGLYELRRAKPPAEDWVLLVDFTVSVGTQKALLVVGAPLSAMAEQGFNLGHQSVSVLGLSLMSKSSGEAVAKELEAITQRVGGVRLVVSDAGSDVKKGVRLFCQGHPETDWNYDVTHGLARLLERELGADPVWEGFKSQAAACRGACQQTVWAHLLPPAQRLKARWLNLRPLVGWGIKLLAYAKERQPGDPKFAELFGWLQDYAGVLPEYLSLVEMVEGVCRRIKHEGLHRPGVRACRRQLRTAGQTQRVREFGKRVLEFLSEQLRKVEPGERLLASSDVIESLFGKYKAILARSPLQAVTSMVLVLAALTASRSESTIKTAMEEVSMADVGQWFAEHGEPSLLAKRREAFAGNNTA